MKPVWRPNFVLPLPLQVQLVSLSTSRTSVTFTAASALCGLSLRDLTSKDIQPARAAKPVAAETASDMLYSVQWQVAASAPGAAPLLEPIHLGSLAAVFTSSAVAGTVQASEGGVVPQLAHLLELLQSGAFARGNAEWCLASAQVPYPTCSRFSTEGDATSAAALHSLLKVAVAEHMLQPDTSIALGSTITKSVMATGISSQFGVAVHGRVACSPLLLVNRKAHPTAGSAPLPIAQLHNITAFVTGGLGGLGKLTARWLMLTGARHIVLLNRSGSLAAHLEPDLVQLTQTTVLQCDISAAGDVANVICGQGPSCLIHAGGVLRDAALTNQTAEKLRIVAAPKLTGKFFQGVGCGVGCCTALWPQLKLKLTSLAPLQA
jgi:hypothetical protein